MDIEPLTIEQVAECTGLSAHTLRYYERIGLLDPVGRATSGHRRYGTKDKERIYRCVLLLESGMQWEMPHWRWHLLPCLRLVPISSWSHPCSPRLPNNIGSFRGWPAMP